MNGKMILWSILFYIANIKSVYYLIENILLFFQMEKIIRGMQHAETGVPVRCQKIFLTTIPCAFTGNHQFLFIDIFPNLCYEI